MADDVLRKTCKKPVAGVSGAGPPMLKSEGANMERERGLFLDFRVQPSPRWRGSPFIEGYCITCEVTEQIVLFVIIEHDHVH